MKTRMRSLIWGLCGWLILSPAVRGQGCCSIGTSALGGPERGAASAGELVVGAGYHYDLLDQGYNGSRRIDDPLQRNATVEMVGLEVEYGLAEAVALLVQFGYFSKSRTITLHGSAGDPAERLAFQGHGMGDLLALAKYQLIRASLTKPYELALGGGAKLPTGRFRQEIHGARLSLDLQAGTGATDLVAWLYGSYTHLPRGLQLSAWMLYRYPGMNFDSYRYGDEILIHLGVGYSLSEFLHLSLAAHARAADRDFSNGRFLQSTGGVQLFLLPSFSYLSSDSSFRVFTQLPIHQNLYGIQLGLSYLLGVEFRYHFRFSSS
jgi:hypothetical protein